MSGFFSGAANGAQIGGMTGNPWLALGGGVAGGIAGMFGGPSDAEIAAERQYQLQMLQYYQMLDQAAKQEKLGRATQVDAQGGRTYYDPATNTWVAEPSAIEKSLIDAQSNESLARNVTDALARRRGLQTNERARIAEGGLAQSRLRDYVNETVNPSTTQAGLAGALAEQALRGVNDSYAKQRGDLSRIALRTGSNGGDILAKLGKAQAESSGRALMDAKLQAMTQAPALAQAKREALLGEYNTLGNRATNAYDSPIQTNQIGSTLAQALMNQSGRYDNSVTNATTTMQNAFAHLPQEPVQPNVDYLAGTKDFLKGFSSMKTRKGQTFGNYFDQYF